MHEPLALRRRTFALPARPRHLAFAPDGAALAAAIDGRVLVIDLATGALRTHRGHAQGLVWTARALLAHTGTGLRPLGKRARGPATIVAALPNQDTVLLDDDGAPAGTLPASWRAAVRGGAVALATGEHLEIHDAVTRAPIARHAIATYHAVLSPDGARVLATGPCGTWEGPCRGPLTWYPESGELAHAGRPFAIGRTLYDHPGAAPRRVHMQDISALAFSPDGRTLAIGSRASVQLIDLDAIAASPAPVGPEDQFAAIAADPARDRVAAIDRGGLVCVWRASDRRLLSTFRVDAGEHPLVFADDGAVLVGTTGLEVWDGDAGTRRAAVPIPGLDRVVALAVSPTTLAVRDTRRVVLLEPDLRVRHTLGSDDENYIHAIALSPDGRHLGVARDDRPALVLATADLAQRRELPPARAIVLGDRLLAYATDGRGALTTLDGTDDAEQILPFTAAEPHADAILWQYSDRVGLRAPHDVRLDVRYASTIHAVTRAVAPTRFLTAGDRWLGERSLRDGTLRRVFAAGASERITALAFDPTGERLAVGETHGRLHVWQLGPAPARIGLLDGTALQPAGTIREPGALGEISALAFTADFLIAATGELLAWRAADLTRIGLAVDRAVPVRATHLARDGSRSLRGGDWGSEVEVHDAAGNLLSQSPGVDGRDRHLDLADDGRRVLLGDASELSVRRDTGELLGTLRLDARVQHARFDAHGRVIGVVEDRGPWFRWDPAAAAVQRWISAPAIDLDGLEIRARAPGRVVVEHSGGLVVLAEDSGTILAAIGNHGPHQITCVALSPDGRRLAVGDWLGQVRVHALADGPGHPACIAALSGTTDGGCWSLGPAGFTHVPGDAITRDWEAAP